MPKIGHAKRIRVVVDESRCTGCRFCSTIVRCPSPRDCIGCLACYWGCPYSARVLVKASRPSRTVRIRVDGVVYEVSDGVTLAEALEHAGFTFSKPGSPGVSLACRTGGCWACMVLVNGKPARACMTPVREGMEVVTDTSGIEPLRIVHGPEPHMVGGKATPWWEVDYASYVEAAMWVAGCNLRCPQCQNYHVTYDSISKPMTPRQAARSLAECHVAYNTRGVAISGGEPTLNRRWLVEFFRELTKLLEEGARKHLDSNGTLLTRDYIDELVEAGCNNIGVEPKCARVETYMKITGIANRELAREYLETAWRALEYLRERYLDRVYVGVGLVYNSALVTLEEIAEAGARIASINPSLQVTVLDYFPAFRRRDITRPTVREMLKVKSILEEQGLKCVIVQTSRGHIGPGDRRAL